MNTLPVDQLAHLIHAAPTQFAFALSGGGSRAISQLLEVPGASRSVLEVVIPYSAESMISYLGGRPDQFCSARTARAMSMAAFRRAWHYSRSSPSLAGLACTASLATDRPKQGPHRAHIALQTESVTAFWSVELLKGHRDRAGEEAVVDQLVLNAVAAACNLESRVPVDLLPSEQLEVSRAEAQPHWQELLLGLVDMVHHGSQPPDPRSRQARAIFPGEFNPLHKGHRRMAEVAGELLGVPVEFEISITNVEKPPLDYFEITRRAQQFAPQQSLWLTRAARFTEKSKLFPGATFVVGIDTLRRIAAPRFYADDAEACRAATDAIVARGCKFLVFGRTVGNSFVTLADLELPESLRAACRAVPMDQFREDISSTTLRRAGQW